MKRIALLILVLLLAAAACTSAPSAVPQVVEVTRIVEVTRNPLCPGNAPGDPSYVCRKGPPTPSLTPAPTSTPRPTTTPLPTATSTPTREPAIETAEAKAIWLTATAIVKARLEEPKGDGFYLVGIDIAPGVWRSGGIGDNCYWKRMRKNGDIIDNDYGMAGGTMYIAPSDFEVSMEDCGIWTYLGPP